MPDFRIFLTRLGIQIHTPYGTGVRGLEPRDIARPDERYPPSRTSRPTPVPPGPWSPPQVLSDI